MKNMKHEHRVLTATACPTAHYSVRELEKWLDDGWELMETVENVSVDVYDGNSEASRRTVVGCLFILRREVVEQQ